MILSASKCRNIAAERYFDRDRIASTLANEIARKSFPHPGRLDANNWINLRVKILTTPERLHADSVALNVPGLAAEDRFHDKAKKGDELGRPTKTGTGNNALQRGANLLRRGNIVAIGHSRHEIGLFEESWRTGRCHALSPQSSLRLSCGGCLCNIVQSNQLAVGIYLT